MGNEISNLFKCVGDGDPNNNTCDEDSKIKQSGFILSIFNILLFLVLLFLTIKNFSNLKDNLLFLVFTWLLVLCSLVLSFVFLGLLFPIPVQSQPSTSTV